MGLVLGVSRSQHVAAQDGSALLARRLRGAPGGSGVQVWVSCHPRQRGRPRQEEADHKHKQRVSSARAKRTAGAKGITASAGKAAASRLGSGAVSRLPSSITGRTAAADRKGSSRASTGLSNVLPATSGPAAGSTAGTRTAAAAKRGSSSHEVHATGHAAQAKATVKQAAPTAPKPLQMSAVSVLLAAVSPVCAAHTATLDGADTPASQGQRGQGSNGSRSGSSCYSQPLPPVDLQPARMSTLPAACSGSSVAATPAATSAVGPAPFGSPCAAAMHAASHAPLPGSRATSLVALWGHAATPHMSPGTVQRPGAQAVAAVGAEQAHEGAGSVGEGGAPAYVAGLDVPAAGDAGAAVAASNLVAATPDSDAGMGLTATAPAQLHAPLLAHAHAWAVSPPATASATLLAVHFPDVAADPEAARTAGVDFEALDFGLLASLSGLAPGGTSSSPGAPYAQGAAPGSGQAAAQRSAQHAPAAASVGHEGATCGLASPSVGWGTTQFAAGAPGYGGMHSPCPPVAGFLGLLGLVTPGAAHAAGGAVASTAPEVSGASVGGSVGTAAQPAVPSRAAAFSGAGHDNGGPNSQGAERSQGHDSQGGSIRVQLGHQGVPQPLG